MSVEVKRLDSGSETWGADGSCTSLEIPFIVFGATSKTAALAAALENAPENEKGLALSDLRFEEWENGVANIRATYATVNAEIGGSGGEYTMSFDCSGGTKHITHAYEQERVYNGSSVGHFTDDANGMIGWNGEKGEKAEFAGVDVPCADMRVTVTKTMRVADVTKTSVMKRYGDVVGKVNSESFLGWSPGELMFMGCSYSTPMRGQRHVVVTFNFRVMPNEQNAVVAGKNIGKVYGCDYVWAISKTEADSSHKPKVKVKGIYKSRVVKAANFHQLGI